MCTLVLYNIAKQAIWKINCLVTEETMKAYARIVATHKNEMIVT